MEFVLAGGDPDAAAVDAQQARLALQLLGPERCAESVRHLLHGHLGRCGHRVRGVDDGLEQAALVEHHVVRDAHLEGDGQAPRSQCGHKRLLCARGLRAEAPPPPAHACVRTGVRCGDSPAADCDCLQGVDSGAPTSAS